MSQPLQDVTPQGIKDKVVSCTESDKAMPIMFGSEYLKGYTCLMPVDSGAVVMMTAAQDQAAVDRIKAEAEEVKNYAPVEVAGTTAFRGERGGTSFVMTYFPEQGIYEEYACGGVPREQSESCVNEIISRIGN